MFRTNVLRGVASFLVAGMTLLGFASSASANTNIRFSLDWRFEGPSAGYLMALDRGFYREEGLTVTIDSGNGSVDGINRIASGAYDLATADINSLIRFRDNPANPPIQAVFMQMNAPAFAVTSLSKTGIQVPKDLEGKTIGAPAADGAYANWPAFVKANDLDVSRIRVENIGFPVREPMLMQGSVDAIVGFGYTAAVTLMNNGLREEDIHVMLMSQHGLNLYGNALMANPAFQARNPDALRRFIRASIRGHLAALEDPQAAVESVLRRNPVATRDGETVRLMMFNRDHFLTQEVREHGVGHVDPERFAASIEQIAESFTFTNRPSMADVVTDAFLPPQAERMVPAALLQ